MTKTKIIHFCLEVDVSVIGLESSLLGRDDDDNFLLTPLADHSITKGLHIPGTTWFSTRTHDSWPDDTILSFRVESADDATGGEAERQLFLQSRQQKQQRLEQPFPPSGEEFLPDQQPGRQS